MNRYCRSCGRPLIPADESQRSYDAETGERQIERWYDCPRIGRSWRNLWIGGLTHDSWNPTGGYRGWR